MRDVGKEWKRKKKEEKAERSRKRNKVAGKKSAISVKGVFKKSEALRSLGENVGENNETCWYENPLSWTLINNTFSICHTVPVQSENHVFFYLITHDIESPSIIQAYAWIWLFKKKSHISATMITLNKCFNCLINACSAIQMRPVVNSSRARLNQWSKWKHCYKPQTKPLVWRIYTKSHYHDPRSTVALDMKAKGVFRSNELWERCTSRDAADKQPFSAEIRLIVSAGLYDNNERKLQISQEPPSCIAVVLPCVLPAKVSSQPLRSSMVVRPGTPLSLS